MSICNDDIAVLARLVTEEHGLGAEKHINDYIENLRTVGDTAAVKLWQKVAAFWYAGKGIHVE